MELYELAAALDAELAVETFDDHAHNGLQIAGPGEVRRVCTAVDATLETVRLAAEAGADLLVCHHGLSWGDSLARLTHLNYRRVRAFLEADLALYACHLPLDAHPVLGNNARLADALGLAERAPFGAYHGRAIGVQGRLPSPVAYAAFKQAVATVTGGRLQSMDFGTADPVSRIGIVSGGAADCVAEAARAGLDVFVSGEPTLQGYSLARDLGMHAVFAGHHATECFGVRALGEWLAATYGLDVRFIGQEIPY
jgi:dinuclear metal center YbgI/SA1388 family protein